MCVIIICVCVFDRHACLYVLYAGEVDHIGWTISELLDWVMTEPEAFAKEVTTHVDKGDVNYIKSCELYNSYYLFLCVL